MTNKELQNLLKTHPEDIKVGEIYNARMQITRKNDTDFRAILMTKPCVHCAVEHVFALDEIAAFSPISPAPKCDPCRKFRKGDKVRVVESHGRETPLASVMQDLSEKTFSVIADEDADNDVLIDTPKGNRFIQFSFLELVTPVEELAPYIKLENVSSNSIEVRDKRTNKVEASFYFGKDHAYTFVQAATRAEAERDRLNAEHRKEGK